MRVGSLTQENENWIRKREIISKGFRHNLFRFSVLGLYPTPSPGMFCYMECFTLGDQVTMRLLGLG